MAKLIRGPWQADLVEEEGTRNPLPRALQLVLMALVVIVAAVLGSFVIPLEEPAPPSSARRTRQLFRAPALIQAPTSPTNVPESMGLPAGIAPLARRK